MLLSLYVITLPFAISDDVKETVKALIFTLSADRYVLWCLFIKSNDQADAPSYIDHFIYTSSVEIVDVINVIIVSSLFFLSLLVLYKNISVSDDNNSLLIISLLLNALFPNNILSFTSELVISGLLLFTAIYDPQSRIILCSFNVAITLRICIGSIL